ncbi:hypothetical protein [Streptomyces sp. NRRL B-24484]|uniref:hypothetical protein n=1 Tax=Streptomyces sp. NRRL B-24484 TaxID=1463833 RepID=UPI0004BFF6DF|nr:hypothetical protein [Streptomyces sp. NRRL B-24484]
MGSRGTSFAETLLGTARMTGEAEEHPVRLDLAVRAGTLVLPHRTTVAAVTGRVRIRGIADDPRATGELEISPSRPGRIRYRLEFTAGGRRFTLDGRKSLSLRRPVRSATVLPYTLSADGREAGRGTLRLPWTGLLPFLASWRFPRHGEGARQLGTRWDGRPGRLEVWYATLTEPAGGTGVWLHRELVAPADGSPARVHGWIALFPPDGPPTHARFGPEPWPPRREFSAAADTENEDGKGNGVRHLRGTAGPYTWDLTEQPAGDPLYTFPRWAWHHGGLPAAQMLPAAVSRYTGTIEHPGGVLRLDAAPGATARIHGHGNAERWAWLHADLGGGDVLEVVAAVSGRPGLDRLPPLVFLRLRHRGRTWPRSAARPALGWAGPGRFRARICLPTWTVTGRTLLRRVRVTVTQAEERTLTLAYTDPDGRRAVCRNSEAADARIVLERWWGRWRPEAAWTLTGTAHAEVGGR